MVELRAGSGIALAEDTAAGTLTVSASVGAAVTPQQFGAGAVGVTDDTAALVAAFSYLNNAGGGELYFPEGIYLHGLVALSSLPASAWKTSLAAVQSTGNIGLPLVGLRGAKITGHKGAVLKRKDASCTTTTTDWLSWAQIFLYDCQDVEISGFTMDGNRAGQTNTAAMSTGAANHHILMLPAFEGGVMVPVDRVRVHDMKFQHAGTLLTAGDKQGDCFYMRNGVNDIQIDHNEFLDWARWAASLNVGWPIAGGYTGTNGLDMHDNIYRVGFRADGAVQLGAIDLEPWEPFNNIRVRRERFYGSCDIAVQSAPSPTASQVCCNLEISSNTWDMRGQVSGTPSADVTIAVAASWGTIVPGVSVSTKRRYVGLKIEDNRYIADVESNEFIQLYDAIFDGLSVRGNKYFNSSETFADAAMIRLQTLSLRGDCYITGNKADNKIRLVDIASFQQDFEDKIFRLTIDDNSVMQCNQALLFTGPTFMLNGTGTVATTSGSKTITGTGTKFRKELRVGGTITVTSSGETLTIAAITSDTAATAVANAANTAATGAFTRTPGTVTIDGNHTPTQLAGGGTVITANNALVKWGRRNSIANVITLTNVSTPGRGSAVLATGTTSIVVSHGLLGTPTNVSVTPVTSLGSAAKWWVTAIGTTTFTINVDVNPAANVTFNWNAEAANG